MIEIRVSITDHVPAKASARMTQTHTSATTGPRTDDEIAVRDRGVTLSGSEGRQVEDACWSVPGVAVVENDPRIGL